MSKRSIKFKLTFWFSIILVLTGILTFLFVRTAGGMVLSGTIRDYLISMVEENTNKIVYTETKDEDPGNPNIYIPYKKGFLEIDSDFLDVVNDVYAALYSQDGELIYGQNPLEKETKDLSFTTSHVWSVDIEGDKYEIYDRMLIIEVPDGGTLWIRGVVPVTAGQTQLNEITRISLLIIPPLLCLLVLVGYLLTGRLLSPLKKIETTAEQISEGSDLKQRIEVTSEDEVGHLASMFNEMLDRLEKSFNTERQFTSDASHELRTPTSVIMAQSEYTLEKERSKEEYIEAMQVVHKQSQRMNVLIGDMLDYTRMDQKSERYEMSKQNLSKIAVEIVEQMKLLGEKNITLTEDIEPSLNVIGNEVLLSRLFQNLIGNSYRYGNENGSIRVSLKSEGDSAIIIVADDGIGMMEEDLGKIFDRFYRSDSSRSIQGTGLGLAMVKKIVELHHGEISVESELGKGSTFRVSLPMI